MEARNYMYIYYTTATLSLAAVVINIGGPISLRGVLMGPEICDLDEALTFSPPTSYVYRIPPWGYRFVLTFIYIYNIGTIFACTTFVYIKRCFCKNFN